MNIYTTQKIKNMIPTNDNKKFTIKDLIEKITGKRCLSLCINGLNKEELTWKKNIFSN